MVIDRYVVLEQLGRGGMGVVYAAYDPELDRKIALKLLRPTISGRRPTERDRAR
jgi:serine/threonine protein kinase